MPGILRRHVFAFENVAEVGTAVGAEYLDTATVGISFATHCAGYFIVKAGPATEGFKLVIRAVERRIAAFADVKAFCLVI